MRLRNKKTGETINGGFVVCEYKDGARFSVKDKPCFDSLDELKEEWEDYIPIEPLIKDEKIRKAVRAWAEANKEEELEVMGGCSVTAFKSLYNHTEIDFNCSWKLRDSVYTIEELCGEER